MEPLSLILTAVVTGAATALKPAAEQAIKDAYAGLRRLIQDRYGQGKKVALAVESLEEDPQSEGGQVLLEEGLSAADAGQDEELLEAAQALLQILESTSEGQKAVSKYQIDARGAQIGLLGDQAKVEGGIHFGPSGDTFNMSGDFRGANVNIKSTLTNVSQTIGALPDADPAAKAELETLIQQLNDALQQVPDDKAEDAEAVAQSAELLVKTATEEKPNKRMVQISGEGLKQAAKNIAGVMPTVLTIATQIVATVSKLIR